MAIWTPIPLVPPVTRAVLPSRENILGNVKVMVVVVVFRMNWLGRILEFVFPDLNILFQIERGIIMVVVFCFSDLCFLGHRPDICSK